MSDGLSKVARANFFCAVGDFLEVHDLGRLEQAGSFYLEVLASSWNMAASRLFSERLCWGPTVSKFEKSICAEYQGKGLAFQLHKLRRTIFPGKLLEPWVCKTSFCSATVHGVAPAMSAPHQASVPVSLGISRGQTLVVGTTFEAIGSVKDKVCIGIVAIEGSGSSRNTAVMFAPFSRECFIHYGCNGAIFKKQAIPCQAIPCQGSRHDAHGQCVAKIWVQVTSAGGIRFLSESGGAEIIETGFVPPEFLPKAVDEYFASMYFWLRDLTATVTASIDYSGSKFPSSMHVLKKPPFQMDTAWELSNEELW